MKLYIVCLLVALGCAAVMPAPAPQQSTNVGASTIGPLTTLYDLFAMFPSTVISSAQNAMRGIPFVNLFPAALQTGIDVGKNVAEGMDHTLLGLAGGRGGSNPFSALLNPLGLVGGGQNSGGQTVGQAGGQAVGQIGAGQPNPLNGFGNLINTLNPMNFLNGMAQQNGQRPGGQVNPLGAIGNTLNSFNPLNYLPGAGQQNPQLLGQQIPNGNNPLAALSNGAAQALNQLSPAALAQYLNLNGLQPNVQFPNAAPNTSPNFIPSGGSPTVGVNVNPGTVSASVPGLGSVSGSVSGSVPIPVPVRQQDGEIP